MTRTSANLSLLVVAILFLSSALPNPAPAQTVSFIARGDFAVGPNPRPVAVGDFNGDRTAAVPEEKAAVQEAYGKLPLVFEANRGQTDPQVQFLSRGPGLTLFLAPTEAVLVLSKREASAEGRFERRQEATRTVLRMAFLGANEIGRASCRERV